jgi:hypothetical protein
VKTTKSTPKPTQTYDAPTHGNSGEGGWSPSSALGGNGDPFKGWSYNGQKYSFENAY